VSVLLKKHIRAVGADDSPFIPRTTGKTFVVLTLVRAPNYLEGVHKVTVEIDGLDATENIIEGIFNAGFDKQMRVFMIEGACVGGFNPVDIEKIYEEFNVVSISLTKNKPHPEKIYAALKNHFPDWEKRLKIINKGSVLQISKGGSTLYVRYFPEDLNKEEIERIITAFTVRGIRPEPVRLADLIASLL